MRRITTILLFAISSVLCYADYSDRGRPSDYQDYHDGPLTFIYMGIGALIVLVLIGFWIYDKVLSNKERISNALGTIFTCLLIFGGMLFVGKCGESLHNSINPKEITSVHTNSNTVSPEISSPTNTQTNNQYAPPTYTPTIHFRTVEYNESCLNCGGHGRVLCPRCKGTGNYKKTCSHCNGTGGYYKSRCVYCSGNGYTEDYVFGSGRQHCITCNGTGYVENNCQWCGGTGYESETCDIYAAFGQSTHMVTCSFCEGSGKIRRTRQESYYE